LRVLEALSSLYASTAYYQRTKEAAQLRFLVANILSSKNATEGSSVALRKAEACPEASAANRLEGTE
jgi:hypothetical protein